MFKNEVESPPTTTFYYDKELIADAENADPSQKIDQERKMSLEMKNKVWRCFSQTASSSPSSFRVLFIGTSNTRTLMTNIQARLEGTAQMSRVSAKQLCDNSAANHTCFVHVVRKRRGNSGVPHQYGQSQEVFLDYYGYKEDLYHSSLRSKIDSVYTPRFRYARGGALEAKKIPVDVVVMSTGINTIQTDASWNANAQARKRKLLELQHWIYNQWFLDGDGDENAVVANTFHFIWHAVTPLCPNMPHFKRYRYRKSKWSGQTVEAASDATRAMNEQVVNGVFLQNYDVDSSHPKHANRSLFMSHLRRSGLHYLDSSDAAFGLLRRLTRDDKYNDDTTVITPAKKTKQFMSAEYLYDGAFSSGDLLHERRDKSIKTLKYPSSMFGKSLPGSTNFPKYCYYYEDPLHHRFLDRAIVDVIMSMIC